MNILALLSINLWFYLLPWEVFRHARLAVRHIDLEGGIARLRIKDGFGLLSR